MKAVITRDLRLEGGALVRNAEFLRFARHWSFTPRACRPYRAQTKGKVERPVRYLPGNFVYGARSCTTRISTSSGGRGWITWRMCGSTAPRRSVRACASIATNASGSSRSRRAGTRRSCSTTRRPRRHHSVRLVPSSRSRSDRWRRTRASSEVLHEDPGSFTPRSAAADPRRSAQAWRAGSARCDSARRGWRCAHGAGGDRGSCCWRRCSCGTIGACRPRCAPVVCPRSSSSDVRRPCHTSRWSTGAGSTTRRPRRSRCRSEREWLESSVLEGRRGTKDDRASGLGGT
jgi:hypothetical protein